MAPPKGVIPPQFRAYLESKKGKPVEKFAHPKKIGEVTILGYTLPVRNSHGSKKPHFVEGPEGQIIYRSYSVESGTYKDKVVINAAGDPTKALTVNRTIMLRKKGIVRK